MSRRHFDISFNIVHKGSNLASYVSLCQCICNRVLRICGFRVKMLACTSWLLTLMFGVVIIEVMIKNKSRFWYNHLPAKAGPVIDGNWLTKDSLSVKYHVYIWQVSPQLSCVNTCRIWTWFKGPVATLAKNRNVPQRHLMNEMLVALTLNLLP